MRSRKDQSLYLRVVLSSSSTKLSKSFPLSYKPNKKSDGKGEMQSLQKKGWLARKREGKRNRKKERAKEIEKERERRGKQKKKGARES